MAVGICVACDELSQILTRRFAVYVYLQLAVTIIRIAGTIRVSCATLNVLILMMDVLRQ